MLTKEYKKIYAREYRIRNREHHAQMWRARNEKIKEKLFLILGQNKCIKCGFSDKRALQFDHINGDGAKDRKRFGNSLGASINYNYYVNHPEEAKQKLQVLCANCNRIKVIEKKEYRWKHPPV